ncbi:MAG: hypothetical protein IPJ93_13765 [Bacteroidota bacterium]|nr:MAG: hypothetical protein IPJ93_13765 [Bacteroidota bacterium]
MSGTKKESHWIPFSRPYDGFNGDFSVYVNIIHGISRKRQKQQNQIFKDYEESKVALYNELKKHSKMILQNGI